jgi:hypothetical protein
VVEQLRLTVPVNPYSGARSSAEVPDCPGVEMLMVEGFADRPKSVTLTVVAVEVEAA